MKTIQHAGQEWQVVGKGPTRADGKTYCLLFALNCSRRITQGFWIDLK